MGNNGALAAAAMLILISAAASDAFKFRFLVAQGEDGVKSGMRKDSPSPTPDPSPDHLQLSPRPGQEAEGPKGSGDPIGTGNVMNPYKEAGCDAVAEKCHAASLVACLRPESKELFLLVHNGGEDALTVNIRTSIRIDPNERQVAKKKTEKINIPTNATDVIKIVLNAGKEDCILYIKPRVPDWMNFQQFLAYASHLTPIHGAYVLFASMVIAGGVWACCKFGRKSRRGGDSGVPYQQLEMGTQPQSSLSVADINTADGWDESWDDSWDEEQAAARPPGKHPTGNGSSNGLDSRPPSKDGWDVDWDD